ncbi:TIGR04540 family protein [Clostridium sp. MSJ-8]|uniref:TIGR04540 family protein n=1 Tax=Clostridium sp. MSJ-8 TaxID=2841510 RepID=UPI001C0EC070|nr:TIGR04540 family protein [Clostridium sp. MSJ-8]MBU5487390.1 TIGR04540 family protein [Clostridium sp. MSJ-8]
MRAVYRNPKELATAVKDIVDLYQDDLMSYEKLSDKIVRISEANTDRFYKNGKIDSKLATVLGTERLEIINDILKQAK